MTVRAALVDMLERVAPVLRRHTREGSMARRVLGAARRRVRGPEQDPFATVIQEFGRAHPRATFIQIGAHDTTQLDPFTAHVFRGEWSGVMVEPVPYVFERLRRRYADNPRVELENAAIAELDGVKPLYYLPETADPGLPPWYDALASFREDVVLKHEEFIPDIAERVRSMDVPCMTFETLCRKHGVTRVDVVQIDTEGYDYEIIKLIDMDRYRPRLLMFEHLHMDDTTHAECVEHVRSHGYETSTGGMDTLCLHRDELRDASRPLARAWASLRSSTTVGRGC